MKNGNFTHRLPGDTKTFKLVFSSGLQGLQRWLPVPRLPPVKLRPRVSHGLDPEMEGLLFSTNPGLVV